MDFFALEKITSIAPLFLSFVLMFVLNLNGTLKLLNVIMVENLIINHFGIFVKHMVCVFAFHALIRRILKIVKLSEKYVR